LCKFPPIACRVADDLKSVKQVHVRLPWIYGRGVPDGSSKIADEQRGVVVDDLHDKYYEGRCANYIAQYRKKDYVPVPDLKM
jgi:hypothetical protein